MTRLHTSDKAETTQERIRRRWPAQLALATERLCNHCRFQRRYMGREGVGCPLLALTTTGADCPYYSPLLTPVP